MSSNKPQTFNPALPPLMIDLRHLLGAAVPATSTNKNTKDTLQELQEGLGYRRFVQCYNCQKSMKIFICFRGSAKSCNSSEDTHTHMDCGGEYGDKETAEVIKCIPVKLVGAVQMATKKDAKHIEIPAKNEP